MFWNMDWQPCSPVVWISVSKLLQTPLTPPTFDGLSVYSTNRPRVREFEKSSLILGATSKIRVKLRAWLIGSRDTQSFIHLSALQKLIMSLLIIDCCVKLLFLFPALKIGNSSLRKWQVMICTPLKSI